MRNIFLVIFWVWFAGLNHAAAQMLALDWHASSSPNAVGYNVYYGTTSGTYLDKIDVGNATSITISNLAAGATYFFAATAYGVNGDESDYSSEVGYLIPGILTLNRGTNPGDPPLIQFPVAPGHWYEVQATTDLQTWSTLWQSDTAVSNIWMQFTDPDAGFFSSRFYRLVQH